MIRPNLPVSRRGGRRVLWRFPYLYWAFGVLRHRKDCLSRDFDLWVDGYPRSGNSFCVEAIKLANPSARIRSHCHLPPFILQAVADKKPGIFLLRKPVDAAISWAIYWDRPLGLCLDYYIDFHLVLRPRAPELFIASFDQATTRFDQVLARFNQRFGTGYAVPAMGPEFIRRCFAAVESSRFSPGQPVDERHVARPSVERARLKPALLERFAQAPALKRKLDEANELYLEFQAVTHRSASPWRALSTTQLPTFGCE